MLTTDEPLSHLGPSLLLLLQLQLLLAPASAFFPNIWSLLAAPGSITHQDLTEEAALNVTLQLFLEQPPPGRPPLRLEDFLDFYSHSNWVELGEQQPHPHLLWPRQGLRNLAQVDDPTCSDCDEWSCPGNLLGFTLLTSGYFGTHPSKPPGKCSHGGHFDQSSSQPPRGGINKDSTCPGFSPHHMLHLQAANLALLASIQAFSLLRSRLGDRGFSRLLDITPASSLSFVLDTTGSMGEEINAAKIQARHIVEQRRGGPMEPTHYVLVPFHDPGFGPVFTTSDPDSFWQQLNEIHALGGGDEPEMCLSALELALQHTPPLSDIFVFTDASPKDAFLTNRVESLTQERRCRVTFLLTEDPSRVQGRPRREVLSPLRFEPYEAVALASGGEVIFTQDQYIQDVAAIVGDSVADLVTLPLEPPVVVPERPLVFSVDGLLQRVTVRIHGEVSSFWIRNPAGVSQGQEEGEGPLGHTRRFGQFWMVRMNDPLQTGTWEIQVTAKGTPRVRVQAQTSLDFLFHFGIPMEDGPHPGLYPLTQPVAGLQTQLLVEVTGLGSRGNPGDPLPHFSHVVLRGVPHGAELGRVPLEPMGPRERGLLAASLPPTLLSTAGPFSLELIGQDGVGQGLHRVAPQPCAVVPVLLEVRCQRKVRLRLERTGPAAPPLTGPPPQLSGPPGFLAPGTEAPLSLRIASFSGPQDLDLRTSVNPSFALTSNLSRVRLEQNESAWGCLWLKVPDTAASDSVVMVTVTAMDREASTVPPTHTFLRLLVRGPTPQDQLPAPVHSTDPVLTTTSPAFHLSTLVTPGRAGGGLVGNPWWGTVGAVLLLLGLASW
ncbi:von Willebrand factor A domain-containing protein 7 isoform X3 [Globicephala melas]|uniref:von Willebrand factor A domain-containing protein 7 isoform X3 n=1 Tax=Globicephala melas TaxID=9731 RepID=UPI00293D9DBB|nr:von Willebrand factor A domain-containing protein 7 isoform X3 [Globicephala melas]